MEPAIEAILEPQAPRRSRLGTVWAVFGAAIVGFVGASIRGRQQRRELLAGPPAPSHG